MSNPFRQTGNIDKESRKYAADYCVVQSVQSNANHSVVVQVKNDEGTLFPVTVLVNNQGDINIPDVDDTVIVGYTKGGTPYLIGSVYSSNETPNYAPGERILYGDSSITLNANGSTVTLKSNGDIVVNGGSDNPITDISTTTDADGHVTDISVTKATNVYI